MKRTAPKKLQVNNLWGTLKLQEDITTVTHKIKEIEEQKPWVYQDANDRKNILQNFSLRNWQECVCVFVSQPQILYIYNRYCLYRRKSQKLGGKLVCSLYRKVLGRGEPFAHNGILNQSFDILTPVFCKSFRKKQLHHLLDNLLEYGTSFHVLLVIQTSYFEKCPFKYFA